MTVAGRLSTEAVLRRKLKRQRDVPETPPPPSVSASPRPTNSLNSLHFLGSGRRVDGAINLTETQRSSLTLRRRREASKSPNDKRTDAVNISVEHRDAKRQPWKCDRRMNRGFFLFYCSFYLSSSPSNIGWRRDTGGPKSKEQQECGRGHVAATRY